MDLTGGATVPGQSENFEFAVTVLGSPREVVNVTLVSPGADQFGQSNNKAMDRRGSASAFSPLNGMVIVATVVIERSGTARLECTGKVCAQVFGSVLA